MLLRRNIRFDKLGVNDAVLRVDAAWSQKRLVGREQFLRGQAARAQVAGIGGIAERMRQWFSANF